MNRITILVLASILILATAATPQEVVISGFPLGQGSDVGSDFFKAYHAQLRHVADTLARYPLARAIVTGGADGQRYRDNNDAHNPALALGRAHALRTVLVDQFGVDSARIVVQSESNADLGQRFRYARVRVARDFVDLKSALDRLAARLDTVASRPPIEQHITEVTEVADGLAENMGLRLGAGVSSSPFGGIPIVSAAVTWNRTVYLEWLAGHTFWNSSFSYGGEELEARRRITGGQLIVYPYRDKPVGILGGWMRVEEISQKYYRYGNMTEGPVIGLRVTPHRNLSFTGAYNLARLHATGSNSSRTKRDQFLLSLAMHVDFGGAK